MDDVSGRDFSSAPPALCVLLNIPECHQINLSAYLTSRIFYWVTGLWTSKILEGQMFCVGHSFYKCRAISWVPDFPNTER